MNAESMLQFSTATGNATCAYPSHIKSATILSIRREGEVTGRGSACRHSLLGDASAPVSKMNNKQSQCPLVTGGLLMIPCLQ